MTWILLAAAICFGAWAIWIEELRSWSHVEIMAGYNVAATVIGTIALTLLVIVVIIGAMKQRRR